eukprot:TRINITY_DN1668_c0_g2_i1.p2 TRINITY_DN1668_c0_g2~~TRINITY_DN1668_c0_g2_i1.p2  ORF type:complete len:127 (-),score=17.84 TRINITY_DN1668_c0_g2_i1:192-572(-)
MHIVYSMSTRNSSRAGQKLEGRQEEEEANPSRAERRHTRKQMKVLTEGPGNRGGSAGDDYVDGGGMGRDDDQFVDQACQPAQKASLVGGKGVAIDVDALRHPIDEGGRAASQRLGGGRQVFHTRVT